MSIFHFKSNTIADVTGTVTVFDSAGVTQTAAATNLVRPTDWNSSHNQVLNMGGNTAGTSQISGADLVWAGGNNVTLSANGSTVSVVGPSLAAYLTTAQPPGAYLTTAAQSNHSHGFATTTTNGDVAVVAGSNSNGVTLANPAWITTYAAQTNQTEASGNIAGVGTTFAGTNVSGSMTLNSAGLQLNLSAPAAGGGAGDGYNIIGVNGGATQLSTTYQFNNANNVSFGLNAGTITASASQSADTNKAGLGTTFAGTNVTATMAMGTDGLGLSLSAGAGGGGADGVNIMMMGTTGTTGTTYSNSTGTVYLNGANNVVVSQNGSNQMVIVGPDLTQFLTTAQPPGVYLTTAAQSNHSHNLATTTTNGAVAVVATTNSAGATIAFPSWLTTAGATNAITTAAQSNHSHNFATTTTGGSNIVVGTTNSAGATIGVPAFLTTAALSQNTSNYAGIGTTFAGTNATATLAANTNGVALSLSVAGGGVINQTGPNIAVAGSTVTSGDVYFSNSPTVTFGMAGSTITASAAGGGGGGGATVGGMELFPLGPNTVFSTLGQNTINFQKFIAQNDISFNNFEFRASGSSVSSTNSQQAAHTYDYGLYERGAGASTSIYNLIASSRMFMQASYNSNTAAGFTVSAGGTSFTSSSAGTAVLSAMTGFKHIYMPYTSTITAGGQYAVALRMSSATTGNTSPLRLGIKEQTYYNNLTIGRIGVNEGFSISNASRVGDFGLGIYSATSSNLPATLAVSGLTNALSQARLYMQFEA